MRIFALTCALASLTFTASAHAQLRIVHDTLSPSTPTALTCGFCAGESFGVIFRELPGRRGLEPGDFPLMLDAVEIGIAAATVPAGSCERQMFGGTISASMSIYVGDTAPTGDILSLPATGEWSGDETLVWASDAVPLTLSVADDMGRYELNFNSLEIRDEMMSQIRVETGTYMRVVLTLPVGSPGSSSICTGTNEPPGGFPLRDDDGPIQPERNFIYANGAGWFWNESVPGGAINGDWGIRLVVFPNDAPPDAGTGEEDAGAAMDAGSTGSDAGDAGTEPPSDDGCSCRIGPAGDSPRAAWLALIALGAFFLRRRSLRGRAKLR